MYPGFVWHRVFSNKDNNNNSRNHQYVRSSVSSIVGKSSRPLDAPSFLADELINMLSAKSTRLLASTAGFPPPKAGMHNPLSEPWRIISDPRSQVKKYFTTYCNLEQLYYSAGYLNIKYLLVWVSV